MTFPAPYSPRGIRPSKSPQEIEWSSAAIASRLSRGSIDGPFGTAHDLKVSPTSSRKSKCLLVAWCCWITKRGISGSASPLKRLDRQRSLVARLYLERRMRDPEALAEQRGE